MTAPARTIVLTAPSSFYSREAVEMAARVFETRASARVEPEKDGLRVTLTPKRRSPLDDAQRSALRGEFLNEALNQEYRLLVVRFNADIADVIATQSLYYARGGPAGPRRRSARPSPAFRAETERLMAEARAEIAKTRPRRAAPRD